MYFHLINFCTESPFVHFFSSPKRYRHKAMCVQNYHSHPNLLKITAIVESWPHSDSKVHYSNVLVLIAADLEQNKAQTIYRSTIKSSQSQHRFSALTKNKDKEHHLIRFHYLEQQHSDTPTHQFIF